ncbi:MAG: cyclic-di-AMP receptor [Anaerolineaceae bacterium]|nr:cyclic-di-AMP receptor [Anaerolineaceae bacterium]
MSDQTIQNCDTLLIAVVQAQDADLVENILQEMNISITRLPSTGGFIGRRNATLLIGIPAESQPKVLDALQENCRQRIEYIAVPLESAPLPMPTPTPVTVGGATVFALEVEHYEEL